MARMDRSAAPLIVASRSIEVNRATPCRLHYRQAGARESSLLTCRPLRAAQLSEQLVPLCGFPLQDAFIHHRVVHGS
ncbi:hypothetical protein [Streptomyces sp. NBC_00154]|uniref:hypothetical protein n=1 Tax=Streptomyces sp. NBC_00154 TaxID=2975670 RepID=UPI00225845AE|nr:hypothetical protein [Streptomyces sp. NBC_00154]MCX5316682.1 hypothetical protein [Streptomyces sp. NBC_00154]